MVLKILATVSDVTKTEVPKHKLMFNTISRGKVQQIKEYDSVHETWPRSRVGKMVVWAHNQSTREDLLSWSGSDLNGYSRH